MSIYERPWHVSINRCSNYFDTAEEALRHIEWAYTEGDQMWISKGGARYECVRNSSVEGGIEGTIVTRFGDEPVTLAELRYQVQRTKVQRMIDELQAAVAS